MLGFLCLTGPLPVPGFLLAASALRLAGLLRSAGACLLPGILLLRRLFLAALTALVGIFRSLSAGLPTLRALTALLGSFRLTGGFPILFFCIHVCSS